jgi:hypothetical protein
MLDVTYYAETINRKAPFTFQSDINLSNQAQVGPVMKSFQQNQAGWSAAFAPAMTKMAGLDQNPTIDCTAALPRAHSARDAKSAPINARARA